METLSNLNHFINSLLRDALQQVPCVGDMSSNEADVFCNQNGHLLQKLTQTICRR